MARAKAKGSIIKAIEVDVAVILSASLKFSIVTCWCLEESQALGSQLPIVTKIKFQVSLLDFSCNRSIAVVSFRSTRHNVSPLGCKSQVASCKCPKMRARRNRFGLYLGPAFLWKSVGLIRRFNKPLARGLAGFPQLPLVSHLVLEPKHIYTVSFDSRLSKLSTWLFFPGDSETQALPNGVHRSTPPGRNILRAPPVLGFSDFKHL